MRPPSAQHSFGPADRSQRLAGSPRSARSRSRRNGPRPIVVVDAPSDLGLRSSGVRRLPSTLRALGLLDGLAGIRSGGKVPLPRLRSTPGSAGSVRNERAIAMFSQLLADRLGAIIDANGFPLVLGGDCSILLGSALALRRRGRFGLIFIDGHADFYSPVSDAAGEVASMDLAIAVGREPMTLANLEGRRPLFREEDVVVLGFRDGDIAIKEGSPDVRATGVKALGLDDVRRLGPERAARDALAWLREGGSRRFWIHLDADVLNDAVMPAVDYRLADGLWPDELASVLSVLVASSSAAGMQVTIYNPELDDQERTAGRVLADVVRSALAARGQ